MKKFNITYFLKNNPFLQCKIIVSDSLEKVEEEIKKIPNFDRIEYILIKL